MTPRPLAAMALALLAGCAALPPPPPDDQPPAAVPERDAGPAEPPPGLANLPMPRVRVEPKSATGNSPYVVFGKRYEVLDTAAGYRREGKASWYGRKFHGRRTSSGEPYDMYKLTAAHRSLPIPTYVRVVNLDNGRRVIVRVNDRGPFHPERIIDLSYAAAVKLGFQDQGIANVRVESVRPAESETPAPNSKRFFVYAGPFQDLGDADAIHAEVSALAHTPTDVVRWNGALRVRVGPLATRAAAERLRVLLEFQDAPIRQLIISEE